MNYSIVWFKTDLRVEDNETLSTAIKWSDGIIPVYCFDDSHFVETNFGTKKMGNFRVKFLKESLIDLDNNLRKKGSGLIIVKGKPEEALLEIATKYKATKIFSKLEIGIEEIATERKVKSSLATINCTMYNYDTTTLYKEDDMPFELKYLPDVFTGFRNKLEKNWIVRDLFTTENIITSPEIEPLQLPSFEELNATIIEIDSRAAIQFEGGETKAYNRLQHYFFNSKQISQYKITRNGMIGADYSSKFSAWLALGCISPVKIYDQLKKYELQFGANESTYWLVFELLWRDYFYFVMKKYSNKLFLKNGIKIETIKHTSFHKKYFEQWINGETGSAFVDANMNELRLTGFMSNRGRQNVASYLCNDMKMDWRYGAAYFEQQLIDYDVSSNWGNWAYIAGVGNDPRPNRYFNIEKQANDYDAAGLYRKLWLL